MKDYTQIVVSLHAVARALENDKQTWVFGNELRDLADRLHRVTKYNNYVFTEEEERVAEYLAAINGMTLEER